MIQLRIRTISYVFLNLFPFLMIGGEFSLDGFDLFNGLSNNKLKDNSMFKVVAFWLLLRLLDSSLCTLDPVIMLKRQQVLMLNKDIIEICSIICIIRKEELLVIIYPMNWILRGYLKATSTFFLLTFFYYLILVTL